MTPQERPNVKHYPKRFRPVLEWMDCHPRTGWYIAVVVTLNFLLGILNLIDVDPLWFAR